MRFNPRICKGKDLSKSRKDQDRPSLRGRVAEIRKPSGFQIPGVQGEGVVRQKVLTHEIPKAS
jgi:hypothetical protein